MYSEIIEITGKIILTIFLAGLIGAERHVRHKGAGLRTHILVGVGSALIVLTSFYDTVTGLTTAASLWIVSGIGMAVGVGHYTAALIVSLVVFFVLVGLRTFEKQLSKRFNVDV